MAELSDIPAVRVRYEPGDCLLVTSTTDMTTDETAKIIKAVKKFAGVDVAVMVVNRTRAGVILRRSGGNDLTLVMPTRIKTPGREIRRVGVDVAKVDFQTGDTLEIHVHPMYYGAASAAFREWVRHKNVDLKILKIPVVE